MSYLQGFQPDLFISYSHIDDQPFGEDQKRWVSEFHKNLETRIRILLGRDVDIWRDLKLKGTDVFSDEIRGKVSDTAVLVTIISPGYLHSEWCSRELQTFIDAAAASGGWDAGGRSRIVKVLKTPVPLQQQSSGLRSLLGYEFYRIEPETDRVREFLLDPSPEARKSYWTKLDDVAQDVARLFSLLQSGGKQQHDPAKVIYVAETTSDLKDKRDSLTRELVAHGYNPLPNGPLPLNSTDLPNAVRRNLEQSCLSVHLIGARYGIVPEGESRSLIQVQNDVAAEHFNGSASRVIVWVPTNLEVKEEQQARYLTDLRMNFRLLQNAELLETSFEELKTHVLDRLRAEPKQTAPSQPAGGSPSVYIVYDNPDRAEIAPVKQYLFDAGFEVFVPLVEGDPAEIREDHEENLKIADAILIYWGRAGERWFRAKMRDLMQLSALRGSKLPVAAAWLAAPATPEKIELQTKQAVLIRSFEGFNPADLSFLVGQSKQRR